MNLNALVDDKKIQGFEFLNDCLMIFVEDDNKPIIPFCLKNQNMLIENVGNSLNQYRVYCQKYDKIGKNNEGVKAYLRLLIEI